MTDERDQRAASLMLALSQGREDAFNGLMTDWSAPLIGYLTRLTGCAATGEDLAQETFVRVYRGKLDYRPHLKFSTWLFTIATNLAKNHHRWKQRHPEDFVEPENIPELAAAASGDDPRQSAILGETVTALRAAMGKLPDPMREAILLATGQGLSHGQIARIQNTTGKAVELRIYRARKMLRELLAEHL
jgi:RNA polymerase sigma-70 factor (ECF subfamily)